VRHDARGNAVWQWAVDTGKHMLDSTSALLRRLEVPGLRVEGEETSKKAAGAKSGSPPLEIQEPGADAGYDPYGRSAMSRPARPVATTPKPMSRLSPPGPARGSRPSSWWRRLIGRR
jgi:hypothetical protein